ncbi:MAG: MAPEG family protein [Dokdonella sp.]
MSTELTMLAWAIVLGLVHITIAAVLSVSERGLSWAAGPRDDTPPALGHLAARMGRASANFLETFAFFAAAVLAVMVAGKSSETTVLGAQIYFWARVVYIPFYAIGVPYVRTLVWAVSLVGIVMVLIGLFH